MLLALFALTGVASLVPMRWNSSEPKSLDVLRDTPVNCVLLEPTNWEPALLQNAAAKTIVVLGVLHPGPDAAAQALVGLLAAYKRAERLPDTVAVTQKAHVDGGHQVKDVLEARRRDQFGDERFILNALLDKGKTIQLIQRPKAEDDLAVAAASILARAEFLMRLKKLSDEIGIALPKGASPAVEMAARAIVRKFGKRLLVDPT